MGLLGWNRGGIVKKFVFGVVVGSLVTYVAMAAAMDDLMGKFESMGRKE